MLCRLDALSSSKFFHIANFASAWAVDGGAACVQTGTTRIPKTKIPASEFFIFNLRMYSALCE